MRVEDAAARVKVSTRTIYRWIATGQLRATRVRESFPNNTLHYYERVEIRLDDLIEADDNRSDRSLMRSAEMKRRYAGRAS